MTLAEFLVAHNNWRAEQEESRRRKRVLAIAARDANERVADARAITTSDQARMSYRSPATLARLRVEITRKEKELTDLKERYESLSEHVTGV
jgi:hypothetical protein